MNKDLGFFVQARLGSTRLPNKMILPFWEDESILQIILNKLKNNYPEIPTILVTSIKEDNNKLIKVAKDSGCYFFQGSEEDVLNRFIDAAKKYNINNIIRVCADNPFLDMFELSKLIENITNQDYLSFYVNDKPSIRSHFGFWAEYTNLKTLIKVNSQTDDVYYHEHVTNYIYENPEKFVLEFLKPSFNLENQTDIRMTIDTKEDFDLLSKIYYTLYKKYNHKFGIHEILQFLKNNNRYKQKMKEQILKNTK